MFVLKISSGIDGVQLVSPPIWIIRYTFLSYPSQRKSDSMESDIDRLYKHSRTFTTLVVLLLTAQELLEVQNY